MFGEVIDPLAGEIDFCLGYNIRYNFCIVNIYNHNIQVMTTYIKRLTRIDLLDVSHPV